MVYRLAEHFPTEKSDCSGSGNLAVAKKALSNGPESLAGNIWISECQLHLKVKTGSQYFWGATRSHLQELDIDRSSC